jgi:4-diphosphocytidyl-2-C-methyl-D-erythritol kinase
MTLRALYDLPAPAKLNLFLHIVGRRPDGYHLLESVFVLIDWADTLHLEVRPDGQLHRHDLGPALPADDLCLRAARALQAASGTTRGADISIHKHVPWGAGMGGGSSDAATTLLGLNRLWGLHWPRQRLATLGLTLGADVPFFLGGHNAFVQGVGERLTPLALPLALAKALAQAHYAVVKPAASIATRDIFEHPALARNTTPVDPAQLAAAIVMGLSEGAQAGGQSSFKLFGKNDLQAPAENRCNEVAQAASWLKQQFGNSRMTGSGSAVFSVTNSSVSATWAAQASQAGWSGRMCKGMAQHPLVGWADV